MSSTFQTTPILQSALARVADQAHDALVAEIRRGTRVISISGLVSDPARALALAALQRETGKSFAIVTQSNRDLETWERDLRFWYCALNARDGSNENVLLLPASESDPYAGSSPHAETLEQRALTLWQITRGAPDFVLLTARALARKTVAPATIASAGTVLKRDEDQSPEELVEKLIASGYMREDPVGAIGEFSIRGGILDVWSPGRPAPVRIEFFGDTVESIREFDPETQLSTTQLATAEIAPMRELSVNSGDFRLWAEFARERWGDNRYARALMDRTVFADEGESFTGWEWLLPLVVERNSTIFDYLKDTVFVIDEPAGIEAHLADVYQTLADRFAEAEAADDIALAPEELYLTVESLREKLDATQRL
jgi:transcription-repair coupling factor (superfamily II helicase)